MDFLSSKFTKIDHEKLIYYTLVSKIFQKTDYIKKNNLTFF